MTHPERVEDYLEHIADAIERATRYVGNLENLQALEQNQQAQDAIVRTIAVIGEAANRIQKVAPEFVATSISFLDSIDAQGRLQLDDKN